MHEGDLLALFREYLNYNGWHVIFARPNQITVSFPTPHGRKSPDLAAIKNNDLLVLEAKCKARDLFRPISGGLSDCDAMQYLLDDPVAQKALYGKLSDRLRYILPQSINLVSALLAYSDYSVETINEFPSLLFIQMQDPHTPLFFNRLLL